MSGSRARLDRTRCWWSCDCPGSCPASPTSPSGWPAPTRSRCSSIGSMRRPRRRRRTSRGASLATPRRTPGDSGSWSKGPTASPSASAARKGRARSSCPSSRWRPAGSRSIGGSGWCSLSLASSCSWARCRSPGRRSAKGRYRPVRFRIRAGAGGHGWPWRRLVASWRWYCLVDGNGGERRIPRIGMRCSSRMRAARASRATRSRSGSPTRRGRIGATRRGSTPIAPRCFR